MDTEVIEFLQKKYESLKYNTVTDWMKEKKVELSLQSCTSVLLRGQDKGLVVMLTLASALNCTPEELQWIAKAKGDNTLWRLISKAAINKEESELLDAFRVMESDQKKLVLSMVKQLVSK